MGRCAFASAITVALGITLARGSNPDNHWIEVRSSHFTVLTDGGQRQGRALAIRLEQLRSMFDQLLPTREIRQQVPLQVIGFKNSKEISEYSRLYQGKPVASPGFCLRSDDRDYIVLDLSAVGGYSVIHEYAHLRLAVSATGLPVWFNEGFAQLYSTIQFDKQHATVGRPPESAAEVLRTQKLMPVVSLFSVDQDSPAYNQDSDPRSIFYAESWLVAHYLWDHNEIDQAMDYIRLIRGKMPIAEAFRQAFHRDPEQFDALLQSYSHSPMSISRVSVQPDVEPAAQVTSMPLLTVKALLAGLHSHEPDYQEKAIGELENVLHQDPDNADAHRDLGYIYYNKHDYDNALPHLQRASEESPDDWRAHFFWAQISAQKQDARLAPQIEKEAQRVITLNPEFAEGYGLLGFALMLQARHPEATTAYQQALARKPGNEIYELNLAELYTLQGKLEQAKQLFLLLQNSNNTMIATAARSHLELMGDSK